MSKLRIFKKAAILMGTVVLSTTTVACGKNDKKAEEQVKIESQLQKKENLEENIFVENEVAPFINDDKILQAVVLSIGENNKKLIGYFYEKEGSLYFHEIFNNEFEYNLTYMEQTSPMLSIYFTEIGNLLTVDEVLKQNITKEQYNEILEKIYYESYDYIGGNYISYNDNKVKVFGYSAISEHNDILGDTSVQKEKTK